jgi:hypothetical protein
MKKYVAMINVPAVVGFAAGYYVGRHYTIVVPFKKKAVEV